MDGCGRRTEEGRKKGGNTDVGQEIIRQTTGRADGGRRTDRWTSKWRVVRGVKLRNKMLRRAELKERPIEVCTRLRDTHAFRAFANIQLIFHRGAMSLS